MHMDAWFTFFVVVVMLGIMVRGFSAAASIVA